METKILQQKKNPFLEREEMVIELKGEIAPTIADVKGATGKEDNLIVVKRINNNFGRHTFTAEVMIYDSEEAKKKIETIPQKIRKKMAEAAKAEAEAAKKAEAEAKLAEEAAKEEPEVTEEPAKEETQVEEPAETKEEPKAEESTGEKKE